MHGRRIFPNENTIDVPMAVHVSKDIVLVELNRSFRHNSKWFLW
jgi:hypothetical protein